jgi:hypothetical protein
MEDDSDGLTWFDISRENYTDMDEFAARVAVGRDVLGADVAIGTAVIMAAGVAEGYVVGVVVGVTARGAFVVATRVGGKVVTRVAETVHRVRQARRPSAAKGAGAGKTVLGKFPDYVNLADDLAARRFSIPTKIWNKMTPAEQWAANRKFLDRMISRGDEIILSNPVKNVSEATGWFGRELNYLVEQGFRLSADGTRMIR